jgi:hypothetical protein
MQIYQLFSPCNRDVSSLVIAELDFASILMFSLTCKYMRLVVRPAPRVMEWIQYHSPQAMVIVRALMQQLGAILCYGCLDHYLLVPFTRPLKWLDMYIDCGPCMSQDTKNNIYSIVRAVSPSTVGVGFTQYQSMTPAGAVTVNVFGPIDTTDGHYLDIWFNYVLPINYAYPMSYIGAKYIYRDSRYWLVFTDVDIVDAFSRESPYMSAFKDNWPSLPPQ